MNEVIREFLLETHENLAQLDLDLITLETDPTERETLGRVFRTLHTIKGTSGFLGFMKLQAVAHSAESLLGRVSAGELKFDSAVASALLATVDTVRKIIEEIEKTERDGEVDFGDLIQTLEELCIVDARKAAARPAPVGSLRRPDTPAPVEHPSILADDQRLADSLDQAALPDELPPILASGESGQVNGGDVSSPSGNAPAFPPRRTSETVHVAESPLSEAPAQELEVGRVSAVSDSSLRVDIGLLDKLMALVGELVLARNHIIQHANEKEDADLLNTVQRLNVLTTELQASVTKTRMQPIGNTWSKFPRLVRDLAVACGKQVRFDMEGRDTELDKTIVEAIRDPLTHMIRNAIDHGIETPAVRKGRGKNPDGRLSLRAFHDGGKVVIEVADDGGGVDLKRVRARAIENELLSPEQADQTTERGLVNLIFLPGFTTTKKVTHFSGRGVGMDVVRSNVEKIGGTVDVESWPGRGTTIRIKIPRTLAIIPALIVSSGGDCYAIPQISLVELVRLEGEQADTAIEHVGEAPVYRLRGNLLPLVYLNDLLQVEPSELSCDGHMRNIVVLQADERLFGLIVDEIHDTAEIVVKPLQQRLKEIGGFAGATIMGDGRVALILDVLGIAQLANVVSKVRERTFQENRDVDPDSAGDRLPLILFSGRDDRRMAIPLAQVDRLEEFPRQALERVGRGYAILYRDEILPIIDIAEVLEMSSRGANGAPAHWRAGEPPAPPASRDDAESASASELDGDVFQFIVYTNGDRRVGLVVGRILDIVKPTLASRPHVHHPGILCTLVIQGRVTEVLDIEGLLRVADPEFHQQSAHESSSLLLVGMEPGMRSVNDDG